jgi:hypothetical protein
MEPPKTLNEYLTKLFVKEKIDRPAVVDPQTGKSYILLSEAIWDIAAAIFSVLYLIAMLRLLFWALLDVYHGQNEVLKLFFSENTVYPDSPLCRLISYAVIGGGMGGVVNGFRSIVNWHSEAKAFSWRFIWKYITLPPLGAVLAAMVYALVYGGIGVLGGSFNLGEGSANQALSAFGIGALSGYGSHKVFKWLDEIVNRVFTTVKVIVEVPDLTDKTQVKADAELKEAGLKLGNVEHIIDSDSKKIGKIVSQIPLPETKVPKASSVDIKIAKKAVADIAVPNLIDKTEKQATDALKKVGLDCSVKFKKNCDEKDIGKVIDQSPSADTKVTKGSEVTITIGKKE